MDEDFNFKDSYQPPTEEFIRNSLTYGLLSGSAGRLSQQALQFSSSNYSDLARLGRKKGGLIGKLISFGMKNKALIKKSPLLRGPAMFVKARLMKQNLSNNTPNFPGLDLSEIMGLDDNEFIRQLYFRSLGRSPDHDAAENSRRAIFSGMPKEALAYLVCTSPEFAGRTKVAHLEQYRNAYWRYRLRDGLKRFPVIGSLWAFAAAPRRISRLEIEERERFDAVQVRFDALLVRFDALQERFGALHERFDAAQKRFDELDAKLDKLGSAIESTNQHIIYGQPGGVTAVQTKEYIMGVPSDQWRLAIYLSKGGTFEPGTEKYFRSILKAEMNVVDAGANLGIYTLHALAAGCNVYSYEPTPKIFNILVDNIGINGFEPTGRAKPYNLAVADNDGEVDFSLFDSMQNNSMFEKSADDLKIRVKTVSLDEHLKQVDHIDVVKIDVEGAEPLVLAGMKNIIARNPDIKIIMEFGPSNLARSGTDTVEFIQTIRSMGLEIKVIDAVSGEIRTVSDQELLGVYSVNVLLQKSPA